MKFFSRPTLLSVDIWRIRSKFHFVKIMNIRQNETGSLKLRFTLNCGGRFSSVRKQLGLATSCMEVAKRRANMILYVLNALSWIPKKSKDYQLPCPRNMSDSFYFSDDSDKQVLIAAEEKARAYTGKDFVLCLIYRDARNNFYSTFRLTMPNWPVSSWIDDVKILLRSLDQCSGEQFYVHKFVAIRVETPAGYVAWGGLIDKNGKLEKP